MTNLNGLSGSVARGRNRLSASELSSPWLMTPSASAGLPSTVTSRPTRLRPAVPSSMTRRDRRCSGGATVPDARASRRSARSARCELVDRVLDPLLGLLQIGDLLLPASRRAGRFDPRPQLLGNRLPDILARGNLAFGPRGDASQRGHQRRSALLEMRGQRVGVLDLLPVAPRLPCIARGRCGVFVEPRIREPDGWRTTERLRSALQLPLQPLRLLQRFRGSRSRVTSASVRSRQSASITSGVSQTGHAVSPVFAVSVSAPCSSVATSADRPASCAARSRIALAAKRRPSAVCVAIATSGSFSRATWASSDSSDA